MLIERRHERRLMNQINVVPYIDVMLVLLVIFMVTAPLVNPGEIQLPSMGKAAIAAPGPLEVQVRADQSLWLIDRNQAGATPQQVTRDELVAAIKQKQAQQQNQAVVIAADKNVRYEAVLSVMDMLQQNQVQKVGLLVKPIKQQ
jgi:biopolymer transport protein TolR